MFRKLMILAAISLMAACTADDLQPQGQLGPWLSPEGAARQLSMEEYHSLSPDQQYAVSNKVLGTVFKGVPFNEFFDMTGSIQNADGTRKLKVAADHVDSLENIAFAISQRVHDKSAIEYRVENYHRLPDGQRKEAGTPLARIYEYPLSRDMFDQWMAYTLANTILFSPAEEIETATKDDIVAVMALLTNGLRSGASINDIIFQHEKSVANWHRFRSPEDNTREMIEIYMGLFDRDVDVPKAATACKDHSVDENEPYALKIDHGKANTQPQLVFKGVPGSSRGIWVTSCDDFFEAVAYHPLTIPRIVTVLVDRFFTETSQSRRAAIVQSIVAAGPAKFEDVFAAIIFSREYLLNTTRPLNFEEAMFNKAARLHWRPDVNYMSRLVAINTDPNNPSLSAMSQPALRLKLGRFMAQPLDTLSVAFFHKAIREQLMLDTGDGMGNQGRGPKLIEAAFGLTDREFLDYLFVSALGRLPDADETELFLNETDGLFLTYSGRGRKANIVLDYISRIDETYTHKAL